jgi:signal transduction histidine kinase
MMMEHIYKPFVAWATKWNNDLLLRARVKLTLFYVATSALLLAIFSYLLYGELLMRLQDTIDDQVLDIAARRVFLERASDALQNQILIADGVALMFVCITGYFLTAYTLRPIHEARLRERRFLADAAHELRMPLSVMKTGVEILLRGESHLSDHMKKILTENVEEINSLTYIANNLLSLVGEKSKTAQPLSPIFVYDVVFGAIKKVTPLANSRQVILTVDADESTGVLRMLGDQPSLSRAFENVIENAIKYTEQGGSVEVSIESKIPSIIVSVKDTGVGISQADLPHIIEPFFRADLARTANEGAGLGLSIVDEIVRAHKGKLEFESNLGVGTTVTMLFPGDNDSHLSLP